MKLVIFLTLCVCGAVFAFHNDPLFVSNKTWATISGAGLLALLLGLFIGERLPAPDRILSSSVAIFLFGFGMSLAAHIWANKYFLAVLCIFGAFSAMMSLWLAFMFCLNEESER